MFGRAVGAGGLGFGVVRDEHASATKQCVGIMYTYKHYRRRPTLRSMGPRQLQLPVSWLCSL